VIAMAFRQHLGLWLGMMFILVVVFFNVFNLWYGFTYKVLPKTEEYIWMFLASLALSALISTLIVVAASRRSKK